jgi:hypothetical protein
VRRELVARVVLVTAPAGGGKSRLLQELLERLRASGPSFMLLKGRGDPMRGGTQFGVLAFAVHNWAEIASSDAIDTKRHKLGLVEFQVEARGHLAAVQCRRGQLELARETALRALQLCRAVRV